MAREEQERLIMKEIKIKLKTIKEPEEIIGIVKDVEYAYSIEDSLGLLGITLTMYNEIDPLEEFLNHVPSMYRYNVPVDYIVYYKNYKYILKYYNTKSIRGYRLMKRKMY